MPREGRAELPDSVPKRQAAPAKSPADGRILLRKVSRKEMVHPVNRIPDAHHSARVPVIRPKEREKARVAAVAPIPVVLNGHFHGHFHPDAPTVGEKDVRQAGWSNLRESVREQACGRVREAPEHHVGEGIDLRVGDSHGPFPVRCPRE